MKEHHRIIIIGAGLSGLYIAWQLKQHNLDVIVLEARQRCGGRILSMTHHTDRYDMGPAWVWPQLQPRLKNLIDELNLNVFPQFIDGDMLYEKSAAEIERINGQSSHQHSYRLENGNASLIDSLLCKLSNDTVHLNTEVRSINTDTCTIETLRNGKAHEYTADKIILALPPRLFMQNIKINPAFDEAIIKAFNNTPTWMSGHSKIMFIYDKPFWRDNNLSGEVFSHIGPLSEIYDGSPVNNAFFALTSFVGLNAHQRQQIDREQLITLCLAQLQRLFGEQSLNTINITIKDWSEDQYTTTPLDLNSPMYHPQYADDLPRGFYNHSLILAGTEVAREHGGYLEGALESADEAIKLLNR